MSATVAQAGDLRKKFGYRALIMVGVGHDGVVHVTSHGETKADCKVIGDYAQKQFGEHLPIAPFQTWFGWGHGGIPMKVSSEAYRAGSMAREYITANTHPEAVAHYYDRPPTPLIPAGGVP